MHNACYATRFKQKLKLIKGSMKTNHKMSDGSTFELKQVKQNKIDIPQTDEETFFNMFLFVAVLVLLGLVSVSSVTIILFY